MEKWIDLNVKTKFALISAVAAFFAGWALTIAAFCVQPVGEVHDSILFILGQALIYAASVFGVTEYFSAESKKLKHEVKNMIENKQ